MLNNHPINFTDYFSQQKRFVGYLTAGYPTLAATYEHACALIEGGVDVLEIGVPFSDPIADGPLITRAMHVACQQSLSLEDILELIAKIRAISGIPIVLFSYLNPLLSFHSPECLAQLDGVLIVDCALQSFKQTGRVTDRFQGLIPRLIPLITPYSPNETIADYAQSSEGFLYYVLRAGVTGKQTEVVCENLERLKEVRRAYQRPLVAGFGIRERSQAAQILEYVDGFVVGSRFVQAIAEGASFRELSHLARSLDPRG